MRMTQRFTKPDTWNGGGYEVAIVLGAVDDDRLRRGLQAVWDFPSVIGCYLRSDVEPDQQPRIQSADAEWFETLRGVATLPAGAVACHSMVVREEDAGGEDWIYFGFPLGALSELMPSVGAFPFEDGGDFSWRREVDEWLCALARQVFERVPFRFAVVGWVDGSESPPVPEERWVGYLVPEDNVLTWHPPNRMAPMAIGAP